MNLIFILGKELVNLNTEYSGEVRGHFSISWFLWASLATSLKDSSPVTTRITGFEHVCSSRLYYPFFILSPLFCFVFLAVSFAVSCLVSATSPSFLRYMTWFCGLLGLVCLLGFALGDPCLHILQNLDDSGLNNGLCLSEKWHLTSFWSDELDWWPLKVHLKSGWHTHTGYYIALSMT